MKVYLRERRWLYTRECFLRGYEEMAELNLLLSEECTKADNEQMSKYELLLGEME